MIGGTSWHSTAMYYEQINKAVARKKGGLSSAPLLIESLDLAPVAKLQAEGNWDALGDMLIASAKRLEKAGADGLILCSNTSHKMFDWVDGEVRIPLLHIADPTADKIRAAGIERIGLLGTAFTMEQDFYKGRLQQRHGLDVIVPDESDRRIVHEIIYKELVLGIVRPESRQAYREIIARLIERGAQGIILGCTEIMLLVKEEDSAVPLFDTTTIHAAVAVDHALAE